MKIYRETTLTDFEFWSGAKCRAEKLTSSELEQITEILEELYPDGIDETTINDLMENLFPLMDKHQVYKLDLVGPKKYLKGFTDQIQEKANTKYQNNQIEINII